LSNNKIQSTYRGAKGSILLFLWLMLLAAHPASAHSPFESNTRLTLLETTVELSVTVGMDGGMALLHDAPPAAGQVRLVGPGYLLPGEFAGSFFEVSSGDKAMSPNKIEVRTDGLEFNILLEYRRPAENTLDVRANYISRLPSSFKSSFVMTDELGNILATKLFAHENVSVSLSLPAAAPVLELAARETTIPAAQAARPVQSAQADIAATAVTPFAPANSGPSPSIADPSSPRNATLSFLDFLKLGIKHILTGYDHLLFLCGLLVACRSVKPMLAIITCFTLAHSLTLALAALDLVQISPRLIEPLIAASIVCVGIENFRSREDVKARCGLALGFGLIHGFGFAGALRETGLAGAGHALLVPLFSFNLGVEIGQLAVAGLFLPLLWVLRRAPWFGRFGTRSVSVAVVLLGGYWLVQRLFVGA
jgi:hydrogenase/urease accessory protein HupE